ncbi:hypothetical protein E2P81_ATG11212 [Venturia nashicola]|uniref:Uncharacterized protein n=1 Tax=Venturia nashicola TaxID=86259 RepID=A0A4Z1PIV7_9PEZI|nr:hypothetical protein E6O75_ATG10896 [Venturia nashicola]TLD35093.1 hypothetical protein E2P81_ATG11212 [Venturia nashicola]
MDSEEKEEEALQSAVSCPKVSTPRPIPHLPLEIATAVVNHLECCELDYNFNRSVWPIHTQDCIRNVQKARLISRDFLHGSALLFGKLLSNTVFTLTPKCLDFLDQLSQNAELSSYIRTLTFGSTYIPQLKPYRQRALEMKWGGNADLDAANQEIFRAWHFLYEIQTMNFKTGRTEETLTRIFRQFKSLQNFRFRPHVEMIRGVPYPRKLTWPTKEIRLTLTEETAELGHAVLERFRIAVYNDLHRVFSIIQKALSKSNLHPKSLLSTPQCTSHRQKGLLAFYIPPTIPLSHIFNHLKQFYWAVPPAPKRLMNSTRHFTTMLSSILNNAPHLKTLHIICTDYPIHDNPKCRYLPSSLKQTPHLTLLDLEGIDIDRDSLLALAGKSLRKLRLSHISNVTCAEWSSLLQEIKDNNPLKWLKLHCGRRGICVAHGSMECRCGDIPENVLKAMSRAGTVVMCEGSGSWRGNEMVYQNGEAVGPHILQDACYVDRWARFGLPFTVSEDGSHLAGTI